VTTATKKPTRKRRKADAPPAMKRVKPSGETSLYEVDPATAMTLHGPKTMVRVPTPYYRLCEGLAAEEGKATSDVLAEAVRFYLVYRKLLIPVENMVGKHLLTPDGTVVRIHPVGGVAVPAAAEEVPPAS
jgi:hypothetical protein